MKGTGLLVFGIISTATAFVVPSANELRSKTQLFGGANGYATSIEGKTARVQKVKDLLETSQMVFTVPASGFTVSDTQTLRRSLPEGSVAMVTKNTLMQRAVEGTDYEAAASLLKGANMWFFVQDDIGGTIKAYNGFLKESGKKETHSIIGGVIDGTSYDSAGVDQIGKLPSKDELYAKIAGSIKAIPTKVARVIKAPNSKLARAIKLATMPEEDK
eukprot:CAMPEP_0202441644 /NCGR_PEP_ID=MMETSP1360-20130828/1156_1 /ASSEMBLY_ACC=CAM_ASM_000848 /TAXON_ID=515479 /ORGANISM="Licmophora paradoxa, Strain CCMP2313" /LENGTH=215 /DNA_ID=CAMNT_0049056713 /DNA_START=71 /DNA_END=721 /DNA_ORIENTATION=-